MNTSDVLDRAADEIERRGWVQGPDGWSAGGDVGGLCLEGGLAAALGVENPATDCCAFYSCPAYTAVASYLGRNPQPLRLPIKDALWQWNDANNRTQAEVIEVLRAAAMVERTREAAPLLTEAVSA